MYLILSLFFFFQAEDGIRDYKVTGVQTCALPISQIGRFRGHLVAGVDYLTGIRASRPPSVEERIHGIPIVEPRSEEHTSEIQSPCNLVCRLLLEKKKKLANPITAPGQPVTSVDLR